MEIQGLSLSGKIFIFTTLALSKLLYTYTMNQHNALQKKFIWDNKRPKIKHSPLIADYCKGGYKDVDIEKKIASLKIKWVTRLFDKNFHSWKIIPNLFFSDIGGKEVIFHHNLRLSQHILKTKNYSKFYQELVQTWADVSEKEPSNAFEVCSECLTYCSM